MPNQSVNIYTASGAVQTTTELPAAIFDVVTNVPLIHQVVVAQEAAARQGTAATKTRGMVSGGGRKPYKQKGTGRARQGSTRAPQFTGGGVVHGPQPRSYAQRTPKKMVAAALRGALSDRARAGRVHVITDFGVAGGPSTKTALAALHHLTDRFNVLVVTSAGDENTYLSLRNVQGVQVLNQGQLNARDVLIADDVVFTAQALGEYVARALPKAKVSVTSHTVALADDELDAEMSEGLDSVAELEPDVEVVEAAAHV